MLLFCAFCWCTLDALACGGRPLAPTTPQGALRLIDAAPTTLNPLYARTPSDRRASALIYLRLFAPGASPASETTCRMVERHEPREGGREVVITLAPSTWMDGTPVSAADVCFTVRAVLDVRNPIPWAAGYRQALEGCSVEDGAAVVRFAYPVRDPASLLSLPVLPAHKFETTHIPPAHLAARVAMGSRSEAVRFDDGRVRYSLANTPQGRSHFATVEQRPPSTPELDAIAVVRGEVDGIVDLDPSLRRRLAKQSAVNLHKYDTGAQWMMVYDTTKPPFDTRLPRMAVRAALDRELVRWALIPDASRVLEPVSGPFPLGSPHYDVGVRTLGVDDLEAGTRYLFGKTVPVRLGVPPDMERRAPGVGEMFATLLAKVGFEVQIVPLDEDPLSLGAARPPQGFDLALAAYQIPMAHSAWELLHTDGTLNPFGTSDPALDALLAKERGMSTDDLGEAMRAVHRMVDDQVPLLPLWSLSTSSAWGAAIQDVVITPGSFWEELDGWHRVGR